MDDEDRLRAGFRHFAVTCADRSPLYARLSGRVADDAKVVGLLDAVPPERRHHAPLLFAAVHDLLLAGTESPLRDHYPSVRPTARPTSDPWPSFRDLCLEHADTIRSTLAARTVQTNEVGRSTCLLLGVAIAHAAGSGPIGWLDVGASAGLNLRAEHYRHDLPDGQHLGDTRSQLRLRCEITGTTRAGLRTPPIVARRGLDASPLDVQDEHDRRWLEACVWPDQIHRIERLRAALRIAKDRPVTIDRADAVDGLAAAVATLDASRNAGAEPAHLVVTHSWVLAYLDESAQRRFEAELDRLSRDRDLDRIAMESAGNPQVGSWRDRLGLSADGHTGGGDRSLLIRTSWRGGVRVDQVLADTDDHGARLAWRSDPA